MSAISTLQILEAQPFHSVSPGVSVSSDVPVLVEHPLSGHGEFLPPGDWLDLAYPVKIYPAGRVVYGAASVEFRDTVFSKARLFVQRWDAASCPARCQCLAVRTSLDFQLSEINPTQNFTLTIPFRRHRVLGESFFHSGIPAFRVLDYVPSYESVAIDVFRPAAIAEISLTVETRVIGVHRTNDSALTDETLDSFAIEASSLRAYITPRVGDFAKIIASYTGASSVEERIWVVLRRCAQALDIASSGGGGIIIEAGGGAD